MLCAILVPSSLGGKENCSSGNYAYLHFHSHTEYLRKGYIVGQKFMGCHSPAGANFISYTWGYTGFYSLKAAKTLCLRAVFVP